MPSKSAVCSPLTHLLFMVSIKACAVWITCKIWFWKALYSFGNSSGGGWNAIACWGSHQCVCYVADKGVGSRVRPGMLRFAAPFSPSRALLTPLQHKPRSASTGELAEALNTLHMVTQLKEELVNHGSMLNDLKVKNFQQNPKVQWKLNSRKCEVKTFSPDVDKPFP